MRLVVDTNVIVSGLLNAGGPPGRVVDGVLLGDLVVVGDDRILAEYADVLSRPHFRFDASRRDRVVHFLGAGSERVVAAPLAVTLPDPDDLPFLEVAHAAHVEALVTGNARHFPPAARRGVRLLTPSELVARWSATRTP